MDMQWMVNGEVVFFMFDELVFWYVQVVEMVIEKVKCLIEYGWDVVILLDFIMCFGWVYNIVVLFFGKVLIGGVDVNVFQCLKWFFGVVWNIEEGGLLMIIVMVLIDIGSCMDEVIFEEFKGMGNFEIILDCKIFDKWVYLFIDI